MTALEDLVHERRTEQVVPITVEQYHLLLKNGTLAEGAPIELLDGLLVRKDRAARGNSIMTVNRRHVLALQALERLLRCVEEADCHVQTQSPITLGTTQEPEPDLCVIKGRFLDYVADHPGPTNIHAVMDVADSSLSQDRKTKQRIYAKAGLPIYWIVNLVDNQIEVYTDPQPGSGRYAARTDHGSDKVIPLTVGTLAFDVPVADILPPL